MTPYTVSTLYHAEKGDPGVALGTYGSVLRVIGKHEIVKNKL
jgi:hypothetical protein